MYNVTQCKPHITSLYIRYIDYLPIYIVVRRITYVVHRTYNIRTLYTYVIRTITHTTSLFIKEHIMSNNHYVILSLNTNVKAYTDMNPNHMSVQCTLYNVHCTLYTIQCTLYIVHYTLYTYINTHQWCCVNFLYIAYIVHYTM